MKDSIRKRLALRRPGNCRLNEGIVRQVKIALADGESGASIGRRLHIGSSVVSQIKHGISWAWVQIGD